MSDIDEETRIREYEEKLQLETLKRKVSAMKFPAPERKKPKLAFSKSLSTLNNKAEPPPEMPLQVKLKTTAKAVKLPMQISDTSKSRLVEKPWKFSTKNVDECAICSNDLFSVCHPHISTAAEREKEAESETFSCSICRKNHEKKEKGRRKIVLGNSTLHNLWKESTYEPGFHIDFDCIIGGQIHDVHAAFLHQYALDTEAMDIIIACGVDNVPTTESASTIIFQLRSLVKTIEEHNRDNRVVIATMLYAPKYCDLGVPPSRNMLAKVREINSWILEYNCEATGLQLDLSLHGVEGDPSQGEVKHRYQDWREPSIDRKLHFAPAVKAKIATQLIGVFNGLDEEGIIC